jgi:hypothetical protein
VLGSAREPVRLRPDLELASDLRVADGCTRKRDPAGAAGSLALASRGHERLSLCYCSKVRRGLVVPHPMHWAAFARLSGRLSAVRLRDAATIWTTRLPHFICEPPVVVRGAVVLSCVKEALAFDVRTGRALWRMPIVTWTDRGGQERRAIFAPTGASGFVFVQDVTHGMLAIDPRSGRVMWSHALAGSSSEPATASADTIYVPSGPRCRTTLGMVGRHRHPSDRCADRDSPLDDPNAGQHPDRASARGRDALRLHRRWRAKDSARGFGARRAKSRTACQTPM